MPFSRRTLLGALCATVACLAVAPGQASAKSNYLKAIWGPVAVNGVDQFPVYKQLGVNIYQYPLRWNQVAPTKPAHASDPNDPAYRWPAELDRAVAEGDGLAITTLVRVSMTPGWANGGASPITPPTKSSDYADFMVAVAKRYPSVRYFMVWEEPIRKEVYKLHVTSKTDPGAPFTPALKRDDMRYSQLVDATYSALKRLNRANKIIGGNTTTASDVDPREWIHNMRLANGKPPRMDFYGHNPFGPRKPDLKKKQMRPTSADFSDLDVLQGWLDRWLARSGRNRKLPIFISEYTNPTQVPSFQFTWHVTLAAQASFLRAAMKISRTDPRIAVLGWYTLRDLPADASGRESRVGLIGADGTPKPAFNVFAGH